MSYPFLMRPIVITVLALTLTACSGKKSSHENERATPVTVVKAQQRTISQIETSVGTLVSLTAPVIKAETSGRIINILADVGQLVQQGQTLAEIDPTDQRHSVAATRAELEQLTAQEKNQSLLVNRLRSLIAKNSVSQANLDAEEAKLKAIRAQISKAKALIGNAEYQETRTKVAAPITGYVQSRDVSVGDFVNIGANLFQIINPTQLRASLPFPETLRPLLQVGQTVTLSTPLSEQSVTAKISQISPMFDANNRAIMVNIDFKNPGNWQAGASVEGRVIVQTHQQAIVIPLESVVDRPNGSVIYLANNKKAKEQKVTTGLVEGNLIEITSGLKPGENLVRDGANYLSNAAPLEIRSSS